LRRRLVDALGFSIDGLRRAWLEEAFRVEVMLGSVLIPVALALDVQAIERVALLGSIFLVLIVEILNTAVEVSIDRTSLEIHPLSKAAKDLGSAAVLLALVMAVSMWVVLLYPKIVG